MPIWQIKIRVPDDGNDHQQFDEGKSPDFLCRMTVDLVGRLPTVDEAEEFLTYQISKKRTKVIDRFLESTDYADYFANKSAPAKDTTQLFLGMRFRCALCHDHPFVRRSQKIHLSVKFFLGIRIQCARCHHHPFENWSQKIRSTTKFVLGRWFQCARCHHHPFEHWSQQDFYGPCEELAN